MKGRETFSSFFFETTSSRGGLMGRGPYFYKDSPAAQKILSNRVFIFYESSENQFDRKKS